MVGFDSHLLPLNYSGFIEFTDANNSAIVRAIENCRLARMQSKLEENEDLRNVVYSNSTMQNVRYKFEFVNNKVDLYKKLSDSKINEMFKNKWFEGYIKEHREERRP